MHYYKKNIGDYHKKAGRLTMLQHGAYTLLIDSCYDREQFPTMEEAIDWLWASSKEEIEAVEFVLGKFFNLNDGVFVQKHIEEDLNKYHKNADINKRIALEREAKRREKRTKREQTVNEAPPNQEPLTNNQEPVIKDLLRDDAFDIFYSAGLVKKSRMAAAKKFDALVKEMKCDPLEFANLLKSDIEYRINNNQFGIDKLHPSTYLNQQRWTDEHEATQQSNNGQPQGNRKLSAAERIRERNEATYGSQQPGSGLGLATDGGDIR